MKLEKINTVKDSGSFYHTEEQRIHLYRHLYKLEWNVCGEPFENGWCTNFSTRPDVNYSQMAKSSDGLWCAMLNTGTPNVSSGADIKFIGNMKDRKEVAVKIVKRTWKGL